MQDNIKVSGILGECGKLPVFLGFAPASLLSALSFADVLDEDTGKGYQRRFSKSHSLEFRKYIQSSGSTTIPLTFNLRPCFKDAWHLEKSRTCAVLNIVSPVRQIFSQVDCQHRLGFLHDLDIPLAFMSFLGVPPEEEMKIFNVINGKAKGLSSSLLDFHEAKLSADLSKDRPELFIALNLHEHVDSPWYKQLDLGGNQTTGLKRRASLRMLQKATKLFLKESKILDSRTPEEAFVTVCEFWRAVSFVLEDQWNDPRRHLLTKGIGIYSLMGIAADMFRESRADKTACSEAFFAGKLSDFAPYFDWTNTGPLKGFGGQAGVDQALHLLRMERKRSILIVANNG